MRRQASNVGDVERTIDGNNSCANKSGKRRGGYLNQTPKKKLRLN